MKKLLFVALSLLLFVGCSRESDIRVNGTLRNNHSVIFAFTESPEELPTFIDSIAALDSVYTYDTLTVTVHDTVYFVGFLKYNTKKILRYAWKMGDVDSLFDGKNEELFAYAYDSAGIYSPLFIAVDGANARDTAGRGQYIRVVDTPPDISVDADTLWTRGLHDATIPFMASDSFGVIDSAFVVLLDSKNKPADTVEAKKDSSGFVYRARIPYEKAKDLLNGHNDVRYVYGAVDEDGNVSWDSAYLHFNRIPEISLLMPDSASRQSIYVPRFAFYYAGSDDDNPEDLRYSIRVGKSPDNAGTAPILTDANLVVSGIREKSWEAITDSVWNMDESLRGRLYWQVYVTDGYDTATSPTWNFFLGDLSATTGSFYGYAKFQGRKAHNGIQVVLENVETSNFTFTHTTATGYFKATVDPGTYRIYARDTTGFGYKRMILENQYVEMGDEKNVATMLLEDSMVPKIRINNYTSLFPSRDVSFSGTLSDSGSQIASAKAWLDGKEISLSVLKVNEWIMNFKDLSDGDHRFRFVVLDSAQNVSDTAKIDFTVKASSLKLSVNGKSTSMVLSDSTLHFVAYAGNVIPLPDSVTWTYKINGTTTVRKTAFGSDSSSSLDILGASSVPNIELGKIYTMSASVAGGTVVDSVRFGFIGDRPIIYFLQPKADTSVTMNDTLSFQVEKFLPAGTSASVQWNCDGILTKGYVCPSDDADKATLAWSSVGKKNVVLTLKQDGGASVSDMISVNVIADPPSVTVKTTEDVIRQKINAKLSYAVTANDKYGKVVAIEWGCNANASKISWDSSATVTPGKNVSATINVPLPQTETDNYKCVVRATDDDGEYGYDTLTFRVVLDKPSITLFTSSAEVKINSNIRVSGAAVDTLGRIESVELFCGSSLKSPTWVPISKPDTTVVAPSKECTWYCMMRVTDDDNLTAIDTATYSVLQDLPTVTASEDTLTVSIKDTLELDAMAYDKLGKIVLYQWSCGNSGVAGKYFVSSTSTPRYSAIMPTTETSDYLCIIRITDDDGNIAEDTTKITVLQDPPTLKVSTESFTTRVNYPIGINASASDKFGYIAKREWSCGSPSEIGDNWRTVSSYDTTWMGPATPQATYYCIARATDDDGNQVQDTIHISFTTDIPVITVDQGVAYILAGTSTELTARANKAWQSIKRYTWTCGNKGSSALQDTASKNHVWWAFNDPTDYLASDFYFFDDTTIAKLSRGSNEFYCIVWAQESGTNFIATDTTIIRTMSKMPEGIISMPDTVYLWSQDSSEISPKARYWYTSEANASSSRLGTLGDEDAQKFWWNFSNVSDKYWYEGNSDGTIDTSIAEFNAAFLRSSEEGSITVRLDYFDSSKAQMDVNFASRHQAEITSRKVYFRKAWKNISDVTDSVLELTTNANAPALSYCNDRLNIAYINESGSLVTKSRSGNKWSAFGSPNISGIVGQTLNLACDGNGNLYLSYISNSDRKAYVYKSASASNSWTALGSGLGTSVISAKLKINPKNNAPSIILLGSVNNTANIVRVYDYSNAKWNALTKATMNENSTYREVDMAFDPNGNRIVVANGNTSSDYTIYYYYIASGATSTASTKNNKININAESIQAFYSGEFFYVGFRSRDDDGLPRLVRAQATQSKLTNSNAFTTSGAEFTAFGHRCFNTFFAVDENGNPLLAIDDAFYARNSQVHVYRFADGAWAELGENELPYFKNIFGAKHGYYIRGFRPQLAVSSSGDIYLSMRAQEAPSSAASVLPGTNNGPIVMEYRGDDW